MKLYPYQEEGVRFLRDPDLTPHRYLADEMGLGKTVQALVAARDAKSITVVAPARTLPNWAEEARVWGAGQEMYFTSYTKLLRQPAPVHEVVIMDECHYAKNLKAKRTKAALSLAQTASHSILLSGTPMPNDARELFPVFHYLWPEAIPPGLDSPRTWMNHFCKWTQTKYGPRVYGHRNAQQLIGMLRGRMLRRKLDDVALDLPPLRVTYHELPNDVVTRSEMDTVLADFDAENAKDDPSSSRVRHLVGRLKAPLIATTLAEELDEGAYRKIVVMYYHEEVGNIFMDKLGRFGLVRLDGSTKDSGKLEKMFTQEPGCRVFLGQITAAGTGLNLQAASELVIAEPAWTPDENRQAIKRIHRIGQRHPCRARVFGVQGTLDAGIMRTITLKTDLQESVGLR